MLNTETEILQVALSSKDAELGFEVVMDQLLPEKLLILAISELLSPVTSLVVPSPSMPTPRVCLVVSVLKKLLLMLPPFTF